MSEHGFKVLDSFPLMNAPYSNWNLLSNYSKYIFYNEKSKEKIEISSYFILYNIDFKNVMSYSENNVFSLLHKLITLLKEQISYKKSKLYLCRTSIKFNCSIFKKRIEEFNEIVNKETLKFNNFYSLLDYNEPQVTSEIIQRFKYNGFETNIKRIFDTGILNREKHYRLYMCYELYVIEDINFDINLLNNIKLNILKLINTSFLNDIYF